MTSNKQENNTGKQDNPNWQYNWNTTELNSKLVSLF